MEYHELLDYCRVKKIFDKGFGFLTSLYHSENVFFHFNRVKDAKTKEKLEKLKRGEVYFFFTSYLREGNRRVDKLWLDLSDVEPKLIPPFADKITDEFISGNTNPFEVAYVIKQLRENNYLNMINFDKILSSEKMIKTPSILKAILKESELKNLEEFILLIEQLESRKLGSTEWIKKVKSLLAQ